MVDKCGGENGEGFFFFLTLPINNNNNNKIAVEMYLDKTPWSFWNEF